MTLFYGCQCLVGLRHVLAAFAVLFFKTGTRLLNVGVLSVVTFNAERDCHVIYNVWK